MTFNKIDGATALKKAGIPLPENWGKLSTSRAEAFVTKALSIGEAPKNGLLAAAYGAVAGAIGDTVDAAKTLVLGDEQNRLDKAARKNAAMKVFSDPKYRRTTNKMRRFFEANTVPKEAINPEKPTRQMLRRAAIEGVKQPLDMSQQAWHQLKGFGKVQPFGSSIRQTRNKQAKAERAMQAAKMAAHIRNVAMGAGDADR